LRPGSVGVGGGGKFYRRVNSAALPIHLFRMHNVTDGQTDDVIMPIVDHTA